MYGFKILCEISKMSFAISHNILNPYTAKYAFYEVLYIWQFMISSSNDILSLSDTGHRLLLGHLQVGLGVLSVRNQSPAPIMCIWKWLLDYFCDKPQQFCVHLVWFWSMYPTSYLSFWLEFVSDNETLW